MLLHTWSEMGFGVRIQPVNRGYARPIFAFLGMLCLVSPLACSAHSLLFGGQVPNPTNLSADRDSAKLQFLTSQAERNGVEAKRIEAARSIFYKAYIWPITKLRVCFWNGTEEMQRDVMRLAMSWSDAVPVIEFDFESGGTVRKCNLSDLRDYRRMPEIRISIASDERPIYHKQDLAARNGDWSYPGRAVAQNPQFPTTMNLVGALMARQMGLTSDYYFNVRHEFGHALSLVHEHQRQICKGWFNIHEIARSTGWSEAMVSSQVEAISESSNDFGLVGDYDVNSIMQYNFQPSWYMPDRPGQRNPCRRSELVDDLSDRDKIVVASLYQPELNQTPERQALIAQIKRTVAAGGASPVVPAAAPLLKVSIEQALSAFESNVGKLARVRIQIYPRKVDESKVMNAIQNLGYPLLDRQGNAIRSISRNVTTSLQNDPTNLILYTSDVSDQDVRYVALSLLRAGIDLKSIQPYRPHERNGFAKRSQLIQIGADVVNRGREPLTAEDILSKPLPMYGARR